MLTLAEGAMETATVGVTAGVGGTAVLPDVVAPPPQPARSDRLNGIMPRRSLHKIDPFRKLDVGPFPDAHYSVDFFLLVQ